MDSNFLYDKCIGLIAFILIFSCNQHASAQWDTTTFSKTSEILAVKNNFVDSDVDIRESYLLNSDTSIFHLRSFNEEIENYPSRLNPKYFTFGGSERFTLDGKLPLTHTKINPSHALATATVVMTSAVALHVNQNVAWWEGKYHTFYIKEDWNNALFADKFGHFMGAYATSYFAREGLIFSGVSWDESIFWGSLFGLFTQTYIEVKDGFSKNTGFSPTDFAADLLGATIFYSQHYIPFLQNFTPKWQYTPPGLIGTSQKSKTNTFLDNYNAATAWWSIDVSNLLPGKINIWPKWLNVAFGYGINGYYTTKLDSRFLIGLDVNMVELLPDGFPFWNWLKQSLNLLKFPLPAVEFSSKGTKFYLFYPLNIP